MSSKLVGKTLFLLAVSLACLAFSGCGKLNLFSSWRDREISIDAKYADWGNSTAYYDEKTKTVLNLANDADYMYVCLITRNRKIEKQIMESGLIAWFDPDGGKNKVFGIRFPIGLKRMGMSIEEEDKRDMMRDWQDQEDKSGLIDREKEKLMSKAFNKRLETLEGLQEKLEIMEGAGSFKVKKKRLKKTDKPGDSPKNKPNELSLDETKKLGIETKVGRENNYFVYELKVPLVKSTKYPHAIGVKPNKTFGLGLEIPNAMGGDGGHATFDDADDGDRAPRGMDRGFYAENNFQLWAIVRLSAEH